MHKPAYEKFCEIQKMMYTDPEYLELEQHFRELEPRFRAVTQTLTEEDRSVITEYIGICAELQNRLLELACFSNQNGKL